MYLTLLGEEVHLYSILWQDFSLFCPSTSSLVSAGEGAARQDSTCHLT